MIIPISKKILSRISQMQMLFRVKSEISAYNQSIFIFEKLKTNQKIYEAGYKRRKY